MAVCLVTRDCTCFALRIDPAEAGAGISPIVYSAGSATGDTAASIATGACCLVHG